MTGGAKRIGRAVSLALAGAGVSVVVHFNGSAEEAERTVEEIRSTGVRSAGLKADLSDPAAAEKLVERAMELSGSLDVLVNSASIYEESSLDSMDRDEVRRNVEVNALAPLELSRAFSAHVRARRAESRGPAGAIVNFLDARIVDYDPRHVAYALAKRMLFSLTRMAAAEYAPDVRVNAVAPGLVLPPAGKDESYLESLKTTNPLGAIGTLDQVADAVLFLVGNDFVTGQVVYVDGGRHLRGSFYGA